MIKSVFVNYEAFGAEFANSDAEAQAMFFRGVARELMHWESNHLKQLQFSSVADFLTEKDKVELENALAMLYYKEK